MKVLLCSDIHNPKKELGLLKSKSLLVDCVVCAGDFTNWGNDLKKILHEMNSWNKKVFLIHGNHENEKDVRVACESLDNIVFFHGKLVKFKDVNFVGWGGGGFSFQDKSFEEFVNGLKAKDFFKSILVTHAPPFETCLDRVHNSDVGNESIKRFILKHKPLVAVSGHIHETAGKICDAGKTVLINPGPEGVIFDL